MPVQATASASRRTRNRLREHPNLRKVGVPREVAFAPGRWQLFEEGTYLCWLPEGETT